MRFEAIQDFFSKETQSQYTRWMRYTVRPGNDKLAGLVKNWIAVGHVREVVGTNPESKMAAKGIVK